MAGLSMKRKDRYDASTTRGVIAPMTSQCSRAENALALSLPISSSKLMNRMDPVQQIHAVGHFAEEAGQCLSQQAE